MSGLGDGLDMGVRWWVVSRISPRDLPKWVAFDGRNSRRDLGFLDGGGDKGQIMN